MLIARRAKFILSKDKALFIIVIVVENARDLDYLILNIVVNIIEDYYENTLIED